MILLGRATKVSRFVMALEKEYVFAVELGCETDTLDRWGKITSTGDVSTIGDDHIMEAASRFRGRYQQIAPSVSAIKHKGVPLYQLARRGMSTPVKTRVVTIRAFQVLAISRPYVTIRVVCSSGTYVRSLARDMGRYLGCGACVFCLRRVRVGSFTVDTATPLDDITGGKKHIEEVMMTIEDGLEHLPRVGLRSSSVGRIRTGGQPTPEDLLDPHLDFEGDYVALTDEVGMIVGIAKRSCDPHVTLKTERIL
jgi:tRNA pseudouridine55 synthase